MGQRTPGTPAIRVKAAAASDKGRRRDNNEDSFLIDEALGLYVVADGMGGHAAGEVASRMAVEQIRAAVAEAPDDAFLADPSPQSRRDLLAWLAGVVQKTSDAIREAAQAERARQGMGCTLDVVLLRGNGALLAHVGDSRVYLLRGTALQQLTDDHTVGEMLREAGVITAEQLARHPQRGVLTRAMGVFPVVQADTAFVELCAGDRLLLCSDGLYNELNDDAMARYCGAGAPAEAAAALIAATLETEARDNVTAVVCAVERAASLTAILGSEVTRELLSSSGIFSRLTPGERLRVQQVAQPQSLARGEAPQRQGGPCDAVMVLLSGQLAVFRDGQRVGRVDVGDPFGAMGLTLLPQAAVTVQAEEPSVILRFPVTPLRALMTSDPALAARLSQAALERVHLRMEQLVDALARERGKAASVVISDDI